jgi:hypothetical protein
MPWARYFDHCVVCGLSVHKHMGYGMCEPCYKKRWAEQNKEYLEEYKHAWYLAQRLKPGFLMTTRKWKNGEAGVMLLASPTARCSRCGTDKDLTIHHKDHRGQNVPTSERNNTEENLEVVCRSCHGRLHGSIAGWSRNFECCVACGKTNRKHQARGYCAGCYHKAFRQKTISE